MTDGATTEMEIADLNRNLFDIFLNFIRINPIRTQKKLNHATILTKIRV